MRNIFKPFNLNTESLVGIGIFRQADATKRQQIAKAARGFVYRAGAEIISLRDSTDDVYFIVSGTVRVAVYSGSGKEVIFRQMGAGQMFGELAAIDGAPRSAQVVATSETTIASLSAVDFQRLILEEDALRPGHPETPGRLN